MVTVYRILPDYSCQGWNTTGYEFSGKYAVRDIGRSLAAGWVPLRLYADDCSLPRGDFLAITGDLYVVSEELASHLRDVLTSFGELLPVEIENIDIECVLWNVTTALDALDEEATVFEKVASGRGLPMDTASQAARPLC